MKIPLRFQVFDRPVILLDKDQERLAPHLAGWMGLANILLIGVNEPDLQRLIVMELLGKQRQKILNRLVGHLSRVHAKEIKERIRRIIGGPRLRTAQAILDRALGPVTMPRNWRILRCSPRRK
jgi:hypothetical protein